MEARVHHRFSRWGLALVAALASFAIRPALAKEPTRRDQILLADSFDGAEGASINGRAPETFSIPDAKWSTIAFNFGGGFSATLQPAGEPESSAVLFSCGGNSNGAIVLPIATTASFKKPEAIRISADLGGAAAALGFYPAVPVPDKERIADVFNHFNGLVLQSDGTLVLTQNGAETLRVKYTGTFDPKVLHTVSYKVNTPTGSIEQVAVDGSSSDYSAMSEARAFTDANTNVAAIAVLTDGGRDNAARADNFMLADGGKFMHDCSVKSERQPSPIMIEPGQKIGVMGDSITALGSNPRGYVGLTIAGLKLAGVNATAIPAGHSGDTSGNMTGRVLPDVLRKGANWMTLSCGVNDVHMQSNKMGVDLEKYKKNVEWMVAKAAAWNVRVVLLTPTPIGEDLESENNKKLAAYVEFLRTFAKEKNIPLADCNAAFQTVLKSPADKPFPPGKRLLVDGLHPNDEGQFLMGLSVLRAMGVPESEMPRIEQTLRNGLKNN